jgi:hypothetical protein
VAALILALIWLVITAWVIGVILAAATADAAPAAPVDPHAQDVATFRAELADWDRRGRP